MRVTHAHRFQGFGAELFLLEIVENGKARLAAVISPTIHSVIENSREFWRILGAAKLEQHLKDSSEDVEISSCTSVKLCLDGHSMAVTMPLVPFCTLVGGMHAWAFEDPDTQRYVAHALAGLRALLSTFMVHYSAIDPLKLLRLDGRGVMTHAEVESIKEHLLMEELPDPELDGRSNIERAKLMQPHVTRMGIMLEHMEVQYRVWVKQFGDNPSHEQQEILRKRRVELDNRTMQYKQAQELVASVLARA